MKPRLQERSTEGRPTQEQYVKAQSFLNLIKHSASLTPLEKQKLWKQAVHGDIEGAYRHYKLLATVDEGDALYGK